MESQHRFGILREQTVGLQRREHQRTVEGHVGRGQKSVLLQRQGYVVGLLRTSLRHRFKTVPGKRRLTHVKGRENQMGKVSELVN